MRYVGLIKNIEKIVVSDPYYDEKVPCRYQNNKVESVTGNTKSPWIANIVIDETTEVIDDFVTGGIEFMIALNPYNAGKNLSSICKVRLEDTLSFSHNVKVNVTEYEIGMDTACVAFGINENADEIISCAEDWQPSCSLKTTTDGLFGTLWEGKYENKTAFIVLSGYLDKDACYTVEDIVQHIKSAFNIDNLIKIED